MPGVILLSHGFQSEYEIGFSNGLAENGIDVTLIGSDNTLFERRSDGVSIVNMRGSQAGNRPQLAKLLNLMRYVASYLAYIARHREKRVHVIGLFSTRSTWVSVLEAWLTRLFAGPYTLTVHNLLPHDQHTTSNRWAFHCIYRAADRLLVHTELMAAGLIRDFGVAREKILVVEHGFDRKIDPDLQLRGDWRKRHGIPDAAAVALFFGVIARYKGPLDLLEAFDLAGSNQAFHLVLAGQCRDRTLRAALTEKLATHRHAARIHWIDGFIAEADVGGLLQGADCMALPYHHIDQSGVLLMAFSCGLPVVATDVGSFARYARPEVDAIVPQSDIPAFADALRTALEQASPTRREHIVAQADRLAWRNTVAPLVESLASSDGS